MACRQGHGHVVRELLAAKASPQTRTDDGSTLLSHAVSGQNVDAVAAVLGSGVSPNEANEDGVPPLILASHYGSTAIIEILCEAGADINAEAEGWGTALDSAEGEAATLLERCGAKRSEGGADQPMARGAERFHYGCFEAGENPNSTPTQAPQSDQTGSAGPALVSDKAIVGAKVRLKQPKPGLLKEGDVGEVVADDGSDCVPLKVKLGDAYDYYDHADLVVCANVDLPPDSDRATVEGTKRLLSAKLDRRITPRTLGSTGLSVSPLGFGCHRLQDDDEQRAALATALKLGCNVVDAAPNYTDGVAENVVGSVLSELIKAKAVRRDELVVITKVGNVLGKQMQYAKGVPGMTTINDNLSHCISPEWIEQEITRSLERLQLTCVDCLLLHCPECEMKGEGVDSKEVYARLHKAFRHLEKEVEKGRIASYGVSAAFMPLRPTDPEHLHLETLVAELPEKHHFRVLQFPMNFAEAPVRWVGHCPRNADSSAIDKEAPNLFEAAQKHGFATLINRPLDGIYKESHGVLRFSSLDADVRSFSELQLDNCDALEEKLDTLCGLSDPPYNMQQGASGELAGKTLKLLNSLEGVDCVLVGMRRLPYVVSALPLSFGTPRLHPEKAEKALRSLHGTIEMWYATAIHEADHGTSKDWRLPIANKYTESKAEGGA
eukprot:TRINITY_DN19901_c0_g1_i2.p1 TRINITY_DN19901_c0_g1~~TRINITY_DN19901_c0_g1_i2.p1  ORF type:complete len:725 (+),score=144.06 TRINITY_DN19901_c0_g1_i2:186-2177(+)